MKLLEVWIFGFLLVETLAEKNPSGESEPPPQGPTPYRSHRPSPEALQKRENEQEKSVGWGWNPSLSYEHTSCVDLDTIVRQPVDNDFFNRRRLWYLTGDTKYYYIANSRIFNGLYPVTQEELNYMCFAQISSFSDSLQWNFGYGREFLQHCQIINGRWQCPTDTEQSTYDAASGVDVFASFVTHRSRVVATDNSTYVMFYICVDGTQATLELTTTRPYASPEAVAAFVEQAKIFGIPLDQLQLAQCTSDYQGPYTYPFENYPNGWTSWYNGWSNNSTGWGTAPSNGWNQNLPSNGWNQNLPLNGWNSNPEPSGWNAQSNGWSNHYNNGWSNNQNTEWFSEKQVIEKL